MLAEVFGYAFGALASAVVFGVFPFVFITIFALLLKFAKVPGLRDNFGLALAFAYIGVFLGLAAGGSKEPVVSAISLAAIALIASISIYFFEKNRGEAQGIDAAELSAMLCSLVLSASFGTYYAPTAEKMKIEEKLGQVETCVRKFQSNPEIQKSCAELLKVK